MRILGIDHGDSRIGVAVSDEMGWTAQPVSVISEKNRKKQLDEIVAYVNKFGAKTIVVGMPRNLNGTYGERANITRTFAEELGVLTAAKVVFWDERLSTAAAHKTLQEGGVSGKKRKGLLDKIAAAFILQGYLDSRKN